MTEDLSKQVLDAAELFHTVNNTEEWFLTIVFEDRLNFIFYTPSHFRRVIFYQILKKAFSHETTNINSIYMC